MCQPPTAPTCAPNPRQRGADTLAPDLAGRPRLLATWRQAFGVRWRRGLALLLTLHVAPFLARPALLGGDEPHYALMAHSLAVDRDLDLDADYGRVADGSREAGVRFAGRRLTPHVAERHGRLRFAHGLGLPLLAAPAVFVLSVVAPHAGPDWPLGLGMLALTGTALLAGVELLGRLTGDARAAVAVGVATYFGTPLWFYSRTFFTEPAIWSLVVLGIWFFVRERPVAAGVALGAAFWCKETGLLAVVAVLGAVLVLRGARRTLPALAAWLVVAALWLGRGWLLYGEPFATAQPFTTGAWSGLGHVLLDGRHGLLGFAPLVLVALLPVGPLPAGATVVRRAAGLLAAAYVAVTAAWIDWGGGTCYGPRLLVPAIAGLAVPVSFAWLRMRSRLWARWTFFGLAAAGFAVGLLAAGDPFAAAWSPSLAGLLAARPLVSALAIGLAAAGAIAVERFARRAPPA